VPEQVITGISVATRVRGPDAEAILKVHKLRKGAWNKPREIVVAADRLLSLAACLHEAAEVLGLLVDEGDDG
jgi:hypothetical protein